MEYLEITGDNFYNEVVVSDLPVVVEFWASWCNESRRIWPLVCAVAQDFGGSLKTGRIDIGKSHDLAEMFSVGILPAVALFEHGELKTMTIGRPKTKEELASRLGLY